MNKKFNFSYEKNKFFWQSWEPDTTNAVLVVIHGMGEHSGRYEHVADFFNLYNYAVCAFDHYGHGLTEGKKGDIPSYDYVLESVEVFIKEIKKVYGQKPMVIYGHSMGGNVVANYLIQKNQDFKTAIITSPWFTLPQAPSKFKILLAKLMMKIYPSFQDRTGLNPHDISRDEKEVQAYIEDPLVHDFMSPRCYFAMEAAGIFAIDYAERIKIPVLLMHGKADKITGIGGSVIFYENNPDKIHFHPWDAAYHELQHDIIQHEVMEYMIDFVAGRISHH